MNFYQQVGIVLPVIEASKKEAEKVETVVIKSAPPTKEGLFSTLYPQKSYFESLAKDIEVAEGLYYTGRLASCSVCRTKTNFATYLPELAHVCSKKCFEKVRL